MRAFERMLDHSLPDGVEVFRLELPLGSRVEALDGWQTLTPPEQARVVRLRQPADKMRFAATRATLRKLLADRMNCAPSDIRFGTRLYGKPFVRQALRGQQAPLFNVSHSGNYAMIALADPVHVRDIGVDIERTDDGVECAALARMVFTEEECLAIRAAANPITAFFFHWCGKEAVLKAASVGIANHLQEVHLNFDARNISLVTPVALWTPIRARILDSPHGYASALAWWPYAS